MQGASGVKQDIDKLVSAVPTPYEYTLLSQLAYSDISDLSPTNHLEDHQYYEYLKAKGWKHIETISDQDYYGYLWINDNTKQIVILITNSFDMLPPFCF